MTTDTPDDDTPTRHETTASEVLPPAAEAVPDAPVPGTVTGDPADEVVLLDDDGSPVGTASRTTVHGPDTPLHLAFSCYLYDARGRVLLTRRALSKRTWPGVWTNSFCGHPRPGEGMVDAVHRYAVRELGVPVQRVEPLLPDFRYRAVDASGTVENEVCPVFTAVLDGEVEPDPAEVMELQWVEPAALHTAAEAAPWALSPWMREQLEQVGRLPGAGSG